MDSTHSDDPDGYGKFHDAMRKQKGKASAHQCVISWCSSDARHWAWQHVGPCMTGTYKGRSVSWGTDPSTYAPMCASHHAMLDGRGSVTHCPYGHERAATKKAATGNCVRCTRERQNARRKERRKADPEYRERQNAKNRARAARRRAQAGADGFDDSSLPF